MFVRTNFYTGFFWHILVHLVCLSIHLCFYLLIYTMQMTSIQRKILVNFFKFCCISYQHKYQIYKSLKIGPCEKIYRLCTSTSNEVFHIIYVPLYYFRGKKRWPQDDGVYPLEDWASTGCQYAGGHASLSVCTGTHNGHPPLYNSPPPWILVRKRVS